MTWGGEIERALQRIQAERNEDHLPMESILNALHEAEYGGHVFARDRDFVPHPDGIRHYYRRARARAR
jgi:hypothetical protein